MMEDSYSKCRNCERMKPSSKVVCEHCGAEIISKQDFTKAGDFASSDIFPNAFVGFLGKTEDGKVELAKKEIVKAFNINKSIF